MFLAGNTYAAAKGLEDEDRQRNLQHGRVSARRLKKDIELHGSRSRSLSFLMNGHQDWSRALRRWREEIITSLGGSSAFTPEAWEVLARIVMGKVILDSIDSYCLTHRVINKKRHRVFPIIMERDRLVSAQMVQLRILREITAQAQQERDVTPMSERLKALEHGQED